LILTTALISCDFDHDACGWTDYHYDDFDWLRNQGPTRSSGTGPTSDHSSGQGINNYL